MLPALISVIVSFSIIGLAVTEVTLTNFTAIANSVKTQQALNIAEAGVNYYEWHLNHNGTDYTDGNTSGNTLTVYGYGPYVHQYVDLNGVVEGTYTLYIQPPTSSSSSVVTIRSIGQPLNSGITKTIKAEVGIPSFASWGVVSDSALWFGANETASGPVISNQGIRMDGANTSTVSSANSSYTPSASVGGDGSSHPGVWCSTSVTSPVNCTTRSKADWLYPVPTIDFNQVSSYLCTLKKIAFSSSSTTSSLNSNSNACSSTPNESTTAYIARSNSNSSQSKGYLIVLNPNSTYDLYKVSSEDDTQSSYLSALGLSLVSSGNAIPSTGVIYVEDNVWVTSNPDFSGRVTIAAGNLSAASSNSYANITVAGPLLYSTKNGSDAIGLIAQNTISIAPYAPPPPSVTPINFEVDGALLAERGNVWYPDTYNINPLLCTTGYVDPSQQFLFYGSVATRQTWTWSWLDGDSQCGNAAYDTASGQYISGFLNNTTQYDYNLMYNPPPYYPLTSGYSILSWREVLTHP